MSRLYIGNIPFKAVDADLSKFAADNNVKTVSSLVSTRGTRSLGFGYITVENADVAAKAIEALNGKDIGGRKARVELARPNERPAQTAATSAAAPAKPRQPFRRQTNAPVQDNTLHVGNMPYQATDGDLSNVFEGFNPKSARIVISDGRSKGFGFVEFATADDARKAMEGAKGTQVEGREIKISFARAKVEKRAPHPRGAAPAGAARPAKAASSIADAKSFKPRQPRQPRQPRVAQADRVVSKSTVHVGKLSYAATEDELKTAFAQYKPKMVKIITRPNGASRGYAFVDFENEDAAKAACAANGMDIRGMKIEVAMAFIKIEPATPAAAPAAAAPTKQ